MDIILMTVITVWSWETRIYEKNVGFSHDQWSLQLYNKAVYFISRDFKKETNSNDSHLGEGHPITL